MNLNEQVKTVILQVTGGTSVSKVDLIQELWSGYGKILRVGIEGGSAETVVVKHVQLEKSTEHPRGWNSDIGHQRKLKSYEVETTWYERYSFKSAARVPRCLAVEHFDNEVVIVLEDLDAAGYPIRKTEVDWQEIDSVLEWLARFHAGFMGGYSRWSLGERHLLAPGDATTGARRTKRSKSKKSGSCYRSGAQNLHPSNHYTRRCQVGECLFFRQR